MADFNLDSLNQKVKDGYRYFYRCTSCGREQGAFTDFETFNADVQSHAKQHRGHVLQLWMSFDNGDLVALGEVWEPRLIDEITRGR